MKIILVDKFCRENEKEKLIAENVSPKFVEEIVNFLNERYSDGENNPTWFIVKNDEYELWRGLEEYV